MLNAQTTGSNKVNVESEIWGKLIIVQLYHFCFEVTLHLFIEWSTVIYKRKFKE